MSITKVAKVAGVSHATVSNVINNRPSVSPKTAAAVRRAMDEIGYTPRPVGRRPGRRPRSADGVFTGRVSIVWPLSTGYRNPVGVGIMQGIGQELDGLGLDLNVAFADARNVGQVVGRADGLLALGFMEREVIGRFRDKPVVWVGSHGPLDWGDRVRCDHHQVARDAVAYLVDHGCPSVVYVNRDTPHPAFAQRGAAFRLECERLDVPMRVVEPGPSGEGEAGRAAEAAATLEAMGLGRAGLFVACDRHLAALDRACRLGGHAVLDERPVIGCDNDLSALSGLTRRPATFDLRPEQLGRLAVRRLAERMRGEGGLGQVTITQSAALIDPGADG